MRRKEFYKILSPLTDKLYALCFSLLPDDLQAEQLYIDAVNAYLFKERKWILNKAINLEDKKEVSILRKIVFKSMVKNLSEIGIRRSLHLTELAKNPELASFKSFFTLDPRSRIIVRLRFDHLFSVDEISDLLDLPRFEIIEKIHNAKHLLLHQKSLSPSV